MGMFLLAEYISGSDVDGPGAGSIAKGAAIVDVTDHAIQGVG